MQKIIYLALVALALSACASVKPLLQGANTALKIPQARQDLVDYLPANRLAVIQPDLQLVDETVQKFDKLIAGDIDITFRDAVIQTFGSLQKARELEAAHLAIKNGVIEYQADSKIPVPDTLVSFNTALERDWKAGKQLLLGNDTGAKLAEYMELIAPIAVRLIVKGATGGLVDNAAPEPALVDA